MIASVLLFMAGCQITPAPRTDLVHRALNFRPEGTREITYREKPERLQLLAYPTGGDSPVGAVIFIHGGGWSIPGPDMPLFQDWVQELDRRRLRSFSIEHRITPQYRGMDPIIDSVEAYRYIQANAARFGFPADSIAIMGFSSGGHIAVMTGLELTKPDSPGEESGPAPRAIVSFYAPMEPGELYQVGSPGIKEILVRYLPEVPADYQADPVKRKEYLRARFLEISPGAQLHKQAPPMLLVHGQQDRLVPAVQSISFFWKARNIGNSARLLLVPRGSHNFNQSRSVWARQTEQQALDYIVQHLPTR
jgi:acetyl esterase/lipase